MVCSALASHAERSLENNSWWKYNFHLFVKNCKIIVRLFSIRWSRVNANLFLIILFTLNATPLSFIPATRWQRIFRRSRKHFKSNFHSFLKRKLDRIRAVVSFIEHGRDGHWVVLLKRLTVGAGFIYLTTESWNVMQDVWEATRHIPTINSRLKYVFKALSGRGWSSDKKWWNVLSCNNFFIT